VDELRVVGAITRYFEAVAVARAALDDELRLSGLDPDGVIEPDLLLRLRLSLLAGSPELGMAAALVA
jgi:hypothetical protein